jgi:translation elongation factor EF-G
MDLDRFVNGYKEEEIEQANEKAKELKGAMERLMQNPDFNLIYDYYVNETTLDESYKAYLVPEQRPALFESVICRMAFKKYVEELLSIQVEE